jgi:type I restriction enzyme S subunit
MNAELLLAHYERVSDAPDAVPRLRRFILDLAVGGKLVPQDPKDEPAAEMLKRITAEKMRSVTRNAKKNDLPLPALSPGDDVSECPPNWVWIRLGETGRIFNGNSVNESEKQRLAKVKEGHPFIATKDIGYGRDPIAYENGLRVPIGDASYKTARAKSVLICLEGGSAGKKIGITDRTICFGNKLFANETWSDIDPRFILNLYLSDRFYRAFRRRMTGIIGGIARSEFVNIPIALPPVGEQKRIVAKLDELMVWCDQLETARTEREAARDRLMVASVARLSDRADPEAFKVDARFFVDAIPVLTARVDQIKQLRQSILNLAVRGKLVAQNANDEPASELLNRIAAEKAQLIRDKKLKRQKSLSPVELESTPFELPVGWTWSKADDVFLNITDGFHNTPSPVATGRPYVTAKHIRPKKIDFDNCLYVDEKNHRELFAKTRVRRGDILVVNIGAGCGTPAMVDVDFEFSFKNVAIVNLPSVMGGAFILLFLLFYRDLVFENLIKGGAQPFLGLGMLREMLIPLPPISEQQRIVSKVDELMGLCDQLEVSLIAGEDARSRLLNALLHEALEPVRVREEVASQAA